VTDAEIPLAGGNVSAGVVRVGDTVRRPAGYWTPAVHALLNHLHSVGFRGAPRPLGLDERGREVLEFLPGDVPYPAHAELLAPDAALGRVGRLIRDLHDAVAEFVPPPDARWQQLIPADGADLIVHHDLAPWNLVVGQRWAFIDWDAAGPGTRLWDLAYSAHGFAFVDRPPTLVATRRLRLLVDAYELDQSQRRDLLALLGPRTWSMHDFLAAQAAVGTQPWTRLWRQGFGNAWRDNANYVERHAADWERALLG
jgi:hypothetical protein